MRRGTVFVVPVRQGWNESKVSACCEPGRHLLARRIMMANGQLANIMMNHDTGPILLAGAGWSADRCHEGDWDKGVPAVTV